MIKHARLGCWPKQAKCGWFWFWYTNKIVGGFESVQEKPALAVWPLAIVMEKLKGGQFWDNVFCVFHNFCLNYSRLQDC